MAEKFLVLIVDDQKDARRLLRKIIESEDCIVQEAVNGKEGLEIARLHKPNLIISDVLMPVMDGFRFCRKVHKDDRLMNIPFVFYTATYTDKKDEEYALSLGAEKYIIKPAEPDVLLKLLKHFIEGYEKGTFVAKQTLIGDEKEIFKVYSERLVNKLEKKMLDLEIEITERKKAEIALKERIKELRFLYDTIEIAGRPGITLDAIYRESVSQIPPGWQYPEITGGCITIKGKVYKTKNFKETKWMQREDIYVKNEIIGTVEVCYLKEKPDEYEGPFLKEERELIVNFTIQLGEHITFKQTEGELNKHRQHLEELVEERTTDLETANKELKAFSYSVSHDLRAPLRAIDGFTRILIEDYASKLDKEGKRLGSVIQRNAKKMGKLIDDLLAFSRVGRASMTYSKIDMGNMVNTIYHEVTNVKERKRITFTIAKFPQAEGDTNMMRQVWMNLISNAVKFSSQCKQAIISVTFKEGKNKVTYCIKDNGVGFNMKYVDKLFGVFQRLHSEKEFEGTGVGLALVQRIIRRHDGNVWAEGEVDKGASFYFSLPNKNRKT